MKNEEIMKNESHHITPHFKWKELLVSSLCPYLVSLIELTDKDKFNYYHLISTTLEPERITSNIPTYILQGKRSWRMARKLTREGYNPSPTSQHFCDGFFDCAIDFQKGVRDLYGAINIDMSREQTKISFEWIKSNCAHSFGQLYYSRPKEESQIGFIHIGSITPKHQGEVWEKG